MITLGEYTTKNSEPSECAYVDAKW